MAIDIHETPVDVSLMQELRPFAKRLSAASDELNQALLIIQDKLNALALSVEEWVPIPATRSWVKEAENIRDQEWDECQLGYGQIGDGWALVTRSAHFQGRDPEGPEGPNGNDHGFTYVTCDPCSERRVIFGSKL